MPNERCLRLKFRLPCKKTLFFVEFSEPTFIHSARARPMRTLVNGKEKCDLNFASHLLCVVSLRHRKVCAAHAIVGCPVSLVLRMPEQAQLFFFLCVFTQYSFFSTCSSLGKRGLCAMLLLLQCLSIFSVVVLLRRKYVCCAASKHGRDNVRCAAWNSAIAFNPRCIRATCATHISIRSLNPSF